MLILQVLRTSQWTMEKTLMDETRKCFGRSYRIVFSQISNKQVPPKSMYESVSSINCY